MSHADSLREKTFFLDAVPGRRKVSEFVGKSDVKTTKKSIPPPATRQEIELPLISIPFFPPLPFSQSV